MPLAKNKLFLKLATRTNTTSREKNHTVGMTPQISFQSRPIGGTLRLNHPTTWKGSWAGTFPLLTAQRQQRCFLSMMNATSISIEPM